MALRRPAAPRVRPDRPGAPVPPALPVRSGAPVRPAPRPPAPAADIPAPAGAPRPATGRHAPSRRTLLLSGAAAAAVAGVGAAGVGTVRMLGPATSPFSDVPDGDAALEAMIWADDAGILPATDGAFSPQTVVTRGGIAAALHRFAGTPAVPLEDVPVLIVDLGEDPEQASALLWLHGRGALWGDAELKVHPGDPATRRCASELLAALLRPALAGIGAVWTADPEGDDALPRDLGWLTRAGMVPPLDAGWDGEAAVTRAELATVLHRADGVIAEALEGAD